MAHAKQARRAARQWATILGAAAGIEEVDDFASVCEWRDEGRFAPPNADELLATIAPGQLGWDEGAISAGAAELDRCPKGCEQAYYRAYQAGAVARVYELV